MERVRDEAWPIAQAAVAAGISWFLAQAVLDHPRPVFAPTAAVVALAANVGGRGRQAVEMLVGIGVGVAVGELLVLVLGAGAPQVALATGVAMLTVAAVMNSPLPLIQAGSSAVLIVALQSPESGGGRVLDALVGGGVALVVSQILFPPSPVSLLAAGAREALRSVAEGLRSSAEALASGDAEAAGAALTRLRERGRGGLSALDAARGTARQVSRRTLRGRQEADHLARLDARLDGADLLLTDALLLARAAHRLLQECVPAPPWLSQAIRDLARAVEALAQAPDSPEAERSARALALEASRLTVPPKDSGEDGHPTLVALVAEGVRITASDVLRAASPGEEGPARPASRTEVPGEG